MITVLIVDDHGMFAETLERILSEGSAIHVIGTARTATEGIEQAVARRPDIVLMDFGLPDMDGAAATRLVLQACPGTKVITLTGSGHAGAYYAAMEAGSVAWVRKTSAAGELLSVVHKVHRGERVASDELADLPTVEQLVVHYQPIVDLLSNRAVGFEALVRWGHPTRGLLPPSEFLPRAEETGFINDIGRHVGTHACQQIASWSEQLKPDPNVWVSVNLSASGVKRPGLPDEIAAVLERAGVKPERFVLEVTENVLLEDADLALTQLKRLKNLGVQLALDDFGTGFSSLSYLRHFPFDHVKLDMSFTSELPGSTRAMRLVEAIQHVVAALDMHGIAEGVERPEQARALTEIGWEYAQGFLYSRPVDVEIATDLLRAQDPAASQIPIDRIFPEDISSALVGGGNRA